MNLFFARKQCVWGRARRVPGRLGYSPVGCPLAGYGCLRLNILTAAWSPGFRTGAANTRPGRALRAPAPSHPIHRVVVLTLWHRSPPDAHVEGARPAVWLIAQQLHPSVSSAPATSSGARHARISRCGWSSAAILAAIVWVRGRHDYIKVREKSVSSTLTLNRLQKSTPTEKILHILL